MHTPAQVATMLQVSYAKVMTLIRNGELGAINTAINPDGERPRYKVSDEALASFQNRRSVTPTQTYRRKPRCPGNSTPGVKLFYPA